jgi:hypothetical protein
MILPLCDISAIGAPVSYKGRPYVQWRGQAPGRTHPDDPPWSQAFRYGDLTAKGTAGGLVGVKTEAAATRLGLIMAAMATAITLMNHIVLVAEHKMWQGREDSAGETRGEIYK